MRCTKCNYISFDYNQVCPKCNKDLKEVQSLLNLPRFKPSPPAFLGRLIGEEVNSNLDANMEPPPLIRRSGLENTIDLAVSGDLDSLEPATETDDPELDISFDTEEPETVEEILDQGTLTEYSEMERGEDDFEEMIIKQPDDELDLDEEIISLDLDDVSIETGDEELLSMDEEIQGGLDHEIDTLPLEEELDSRSKTGDRKTEDKTLNIELDDLTFDLEDTAVEKKLTGQGIQPGSPAGEDIDDILSELNDLTIEEPELDDEIEIEETSYEESELVTMEIDKEHVNPPRDKKDTESF